MSSTGGSAALRAVLVLGRERCSGVTLQNNRIGEVKDCHEVNPTMFVCSISYHANGARDSRRFEVARSCRSATPGVFPAQRSRDTSRRRCCYEMVVS